MLEEFIVAVAPSTLEPTVKSPPLVNMVISPPSALAPALTTLLVVMPPPAFSVMSPLLEVTEPDTVKLPESVFTLTIPPLAKLRTPGAVMANTLSLERTISPLAGAVAYAPTGFKAVSVLTANTLGVLKRNGSATVPMPSTAAKRACTVATIGLSVAAMIAPVEFKITVPAAMASATVMFALSTKSASIRSAWPAAWLMAAPAPPSVMALVSRYRSPLVLLVADKPPVASLITIGRAVPEVAPSPMPVLALSVTTPPAEIAPDLVATA